MFKFKLAGHIDQALMIKGIHANNQDFIIDSGPTKSVCKPASKIDNYIKGKKTTQLNDFYLSDYTAQ